jgi:glycogen phosphorylase
LGDRQEHGDDPAWDAAEANSLYDLLEREVIPEFYNRNENGIPAEWVNRIRESMARLTPRFSANRTVREYTEQHYLPAAANYRYRSANKGSVGKQIIEWKRNLEQKWDLLQFGEVKAETRGGQKVFEVEICFNGLDRNAVRMELFANSTTNSDRERHEMKCVRQETGTSGSCTYSVTLPAARPSADYTVRVIPFFDDVSVPLETNRILWQR